MMKNMPFSVYSSFEFGDTLVVYYEKEGALGLTLLPLEMRDSLPEHRRDLRDTVGCRDLYRTVDYPFPAYDFEPLVQLKLAGDPWPLQNAPGLSMRNAGSCARFKVKSQRCENNCVTTQFSSPEHLEVEHTLRFVPAAGLFEINTAFINNSDSPVTLEYLASFSIGLLSLFQAADSVGKVHRFLSSWSAECRPEIRTVEELGLESSWQAAGVRSLRFGQFAGIPVRGYYPFLGYEDDENGVFWGASVVAPAAWEMELSRRDDYLDLSGGLPGRESNGWSKKIQCGERFAGPCAAVGCLRGKAEDFYTRLRSYQNETLPQLPEKDHDFSIIFNEWCTSWGKPGEENLVPVIKSLEGLGVKYFSLDAGWFKTERNGTMAGVIGDWNESGSLYSRGLAAFAEDIRRAGLVPGIWFEFENAHVESDVFKEHPEYFLQMDGKTLRIGPSICLDFEKKEVWDYLDKKMISMLKRNGMGYMKVDYNVVVPNGPDAEEGVVPAERLRRHTEAVCAYFKHIREELPELVIESCASGGHRISPWWARFADMVSGSDAHEGWEIPLIAAHESLLIPARACQVWCAVRPDDTSDRLHYSLAAAFLGRILLSGNPDKLDEKQRTLLREAFAFYRKAVPVLRAGRVEIEHTVSGRWNVPKGYQIHRRKEGKRELIVFHTFADAPAELTFNAPGKVCASFLPDGAALTGENTLSLCGLRPFTGGAVLLES